MYAVVSYSKICNDSKATLLTCPLDNVGGYLTEIKRLAEDRALSNKKCNPKTQYFVVKIISEAKEFTEPTYRIEAL